MLHFTTAETEAALTTTGGPEPVASQSRVVIQHASQALVNIHIRLTSETFSTQLTNKTSEVYATLKTDAVKAVVSYIQSTIMQHFAIRYKNHRMFVVDKIMIKKGTAVEKNKPLLKRATNHILEKNKPS